ncbi:DUF1036 domain-containing protein [Hyphomonas johnsonii]|jgi:uncharacterized membrane protein|uniref:Peptidoglycan binding-like domain-containing protein n=1 Tax=Hyphomonas johnsonii MHS-2 TaxID=1280950 RepID=A0A059FNT5_9PROT|nr:DUF1036 domain-containing protein [Hyphomonas johnsonii]KCZ92108.1 hypothetical protein HJO_08739 [Hyphomonas johnsonii MHS-2]
MAQVRSFLKFLGVIGAFMAFGSAAHAQDNADGWSLCNRTSYVIEAAIGRPQGAGITVEGWTKLQPGTCKLALPGPLEPKFHFVYARTSTAHRGGVREWGGETELCVDPTGSFSLENPPECAAMGLEARGFRAVEITRRTRWTTPFTEIENFDAGKARAAGIQRLLEEAGVVSGVIDGNIGHKTRAAIAEFLKQNGLPSTTSESDLIDFLEQVAKERGRSMGFTVCNRTKNRVWSAIARRGTEGWESRGWWMLEAGGCSRVIDRALSGTDYFVYGEMEDGDKVRTLAKASDGFCVGHSKFAIVGRDDCEASAYRTALFAATPPPVDRKLVFEFFERDFAKAGANER